jgi:hypothetical protein
VSLSRRFRDGLSLQVSYTFAKNLNDTDSALPNTNPGQPQVQNPDNLHQEKAISIQDIPNTFVLSPVYELPFGAGKQFLNSRTGELCGGRLADRGHPAISRRPANGLLLHTRYSWVAKFDALQRRSRRSDQECGLPERMEEDSTLQHRQRQRSKCQQLLQWREHQLGIGLHLRVERHPHL